MATGSKTTACRLIGIMLFILCMACCGCLLPACTKPVDSNTASSASLASAGLSPSESLGGNLHFQNLVLPIGDLIYFTASDGQFCQAHPDGSNILVLAEHSGSNLASDRTTLFYTDNQQDGSLCKISLNGSNQVRIGNTPLKYLTICNDRLYAIETVSGHAISLKPDGTGRTRLTDGKAASLLVSADQLYISAQDDSAGLIRYDLQSGETEKLMQKKIFSPNILDGWLFYADPSDRFHLRAWSLNEKTDWLISRLSFEKPFIVSQGYLYFINPAEQNRLYRLPVNGRQNLDRLSPDLIVDDAVGAFAVCGSQIYYQRPDSRRIYRIPTVGGNTIRIT